MSWTRLLRLQRFRRRAMAHALLKLALDFGRRLVMATAVPRRQEEPNETSNKKIGERFKHPLYTNKP
jgi:hypothetical protein